LSTCSLPSPPALFPFDSILDISQMEFIIFKGIMLWVLDCPGTT